MPKQERERERERERDGAAHKSAFSLKLIIQAGGKGTRLEGLTRNKPKALVPIDNLPIIFHQFRQFPSAEFIIIADYKADVLEKYLRVFASKLNKPIKYTIIKAQHPGTISGIKQALELFDENQRVNILWCDLILAKDFVLPDSENFTLKNFTLDSENLAQIENLDSQNSESKDSNNTNFANLNFVGIAHDFICRWSFKDGKFIKIPSAENGVAGFFSFANKKQLSQIPESGALVGYLSRQDIPFYPISLKGSKEIGTLISYEQNTSHANNDSAPICRPFNKLSFQNDLVIKQGIDNQGISIAKDEIAWYEFVRSKGFAHIPQIIEMQLLNTSSKIVMKKVSGKNIYQYDCLTYNQKKEMLRHLVRALKDLHNLAPKIQVNIDDCEENYISKTLERISTIKDLVPFGNDEFIKINKHYYKNIFFNLDEFCTKTRALYPKEFCVIHGDCTFSNMMFDTFNYKAILLDPRGYFGKSKIFGDENYDWAKLYYSLAGNYDNFNRKKFTLDIGANGVELAMRSNSWADMEDEFFEMCGANRAQIKLLHAIIWLGLSVYAWEDYDSICAAFYNGVLLMGEAL